MVKWYNSWNVLLLLNIIQVIYIFFLQGNDMMKYIITGLLVVEMIIILNKKFKL